MTNKPNNLDPTTTADRLLPAPQVAGQLGVTRRSLARWMNDEAMKFPKPVEINRRLYFWQHEIDAWKTSRARRGALVEAA